MLQQPSSCLFTGNKYAGPLSLAASIVKNIFCSIYLPIKLKYTTEPT